jgi:hypothetical protein
MPSYQNVPAVITRNVYAVLGRMCIDAAFRDAFFERPIPTATAFLGDTTPDEDALLNQLAFADTGDAERQPLIDSADAKMDELQAIYCPHFPCPSSPVAAAQSS